MSTGIKAEVRIALISKIKDLEEVKSNNDDKSILLINIPIEFDMLKNESSLEVEFPVIKELLALKAIEIGSKPHTKKV